MNVMGYAPSTINRTNMKKFQGHFLKALLISGIFTQPVFASPADYVNTPAVEQGEREIDIKYGTATPVAGSSAQASSVGYGYGVTESWFTELYLKQERNGTQNSSLAEWENKFQLTETGKYPVDIGMVVELEAPLTSHVPWELAIGPLLQKEFGKLQLNGNLLFVRSFGALDESGVPYTTNLAYQWQVKYRWQPALEYGLQGIGEVGKWNNWDRQAEQIHRVGPAIFGKLPLGNRQAIRYNAGWLFGTNPAAPHQTVRAQVEYEF